MWVRSLNTGRSLHLFWWEGDRVPQRAPELAVHEKKTRQHLHLRLLHREVSILPGKRIYIQ